MLYTHSRGPYAPCRDEPAPAQVKQDLVTTPAKNETVYSLGYYRSPIEFLSGDDETVTAVLHTNIPGAELAFESEPKNATSYK